VTNDFILQRKIFLVRNRDPLILRFIHMSLRERSLHVYASKCITIVLSVIYDSQIARERNARQQVSKTPYEKLRNLRERDSGTCFGQAPRFNLQNAASQDIARNYMMRSRSRESYQVDRIALELPGIAHGASNNILALSSIEALQSLTGTDNHGEKPGN